MNATALSWLAAEYHLPATYSCRLLFSSSNSALVSPAPGPATVRLALIRTGLEIFGRDVVRDSLFPVHPPARGRGAFRAGVASLQGGYGQGARFLWQVGSLLADGPRPGNDDGICGTPPRQERETWETLLRSVGYWGQANSFATCLEVSERAPLKNECA